MAPNTPILGQNCDSGSGQRGSAGRSLAPNGTAADLEDGEITEDEKSAGRSTASTPILRPASSTNQSLHETKPPPGVVLGGSNSAEAAATPEPARPPTPDHDLASPRSLSDEELDLAKSIVLDLLGWGVPPEYLVDCGVSSQAIYKIFTDLHLRLPQNLSYFE